MISAVKKTNKTKDKDRKTKSNVENLAYLLRNTCNRGKHKYKAQDKTKDKTKNRSKPVPIFKHNIT